LFASFVEQFPFPLRHLGPKQPAFHCTAAATVVPNELQLDLEEDASHVEYFARHS
jgi:hypothetical protein